MATLGTPSITPTASGRTTPLGHFRDLVSSLREHTIQEAGFLLSYACETLQNYATSILMTMSTQVYDAAAKFKTEADSEAHKVRAYTSYMRLSSHPAL